MRQTQTQQELLFDQLRAARKRHEARAELIEFMRLQRSRITGQWDACSRRIAERKQEECAEGEYIVETRTSAATVVRTGAQPWYAIRAERYQWE